MDVLNAIFSFDMRRPLCYDARTVLNFHSAQYHSEECQTIVMSGDRSLHGQLSGRHHSRLHPGKGALQQVSNLTELPDFVGIDNIVRIAKNVQPLSELNWQNVQGGMVWAREDNNLKISQIRLWQKQGDV